jgi:hypothetical protein
MNQGVHPLYYNQNKFPGENGLVIKPVLAYTNGNHLPGFGRRPIMHLVWDTVTFINLVLCIVILAFGLLGWQRSKMVVPLYIAVAFGLFGLSHLATLLNLKVVLNTFLIIIRLLAYLLVTYAVYLMAFRKK